MNEPLPPNPWEALGVAEDASDAAIRTAYRKLVLKAHPDKCTDAALKPQRADEFHRIQQAYELLSDDIKRQDYQDRVRLAQLRSELTQAGGGGPSLRRAATDYFAHARSSPNTPLYEDRGNVRYEERVPKSARAFHEEDRGPPPPPRFEPPHRRASARPHDQRYDDLPSPPLSSRKASAGYFGGPAPDEPRRRNERDSNSRRWSYDNDDDDPYDHVRRRQDAKAAKQSRHAADHKNREKNQRAARQSKHAYAHAHIEEDTADSDSSAPERERTYVHIAPHDSPRSGGSGRRPEAPRRMATERLTPLTSANGRRAALSASDNESDSQSTTLYKVNLAESYLEQRGTRVAASAARPTLQKAHSAMPRAPNPPPRSASPPDMVDTSARRASAARRTPTTPRAPSGRDRDRERPSDRDRDRDRDRERDRKADRRARPEIVEPAPLGREYDAHARRPGLTPHNSLPPEAVSARGGSHPADAPPPRNIDTGAASAKGPLRRAQTSPLEAMVSPPLPSASSSRHAPNKGSKLRPAPVREETSDSGLESPASPAGGPPPPQPPRTTRNAYKLSEFPSYSDEDRQRRVRSPGGPTAAGAAPSPRFVSVEPPTAAPSSKERDRDRDRDRDRGRHRQHVREHAREPALSPRGGLGSGLRSPEPSTPGSARSPKSGGGGVHISAGGPGGRDRDGALFGEVRWSPRLDRDSVRYTDGVRRGSSGEPRSGGGGAGAEPRSGGGRRDRTKDRDAYPYDEPRSSGGRRADGHGQRVRAY